MATQRRQRSRQGELFRRSTRAVIALDENHRLVLMTQEIDWTELEELVQAIRMSKLKSEAGRPPHLRALIGAVVFRATRKMTYRDTEDQIRHYAPARYSCGLTETEWTPDANTIQDFEELLGEDGTRRLNEYVVKWAVEEKLADPQVVVADTTAQEAAIPHPNEMGRVPRSIGETDDLKTSSWAGSGRPKKGTVNVAEIGTAACKSRAVLTVRRDAPRPRRITTSAMVKMRGRQSAS